MTNGDSNLREFGGFRLDSKKRVLWYGDEPVDLPLKEIELLCVLTESAGQVVTKDEILDKVWSDSFVDESNLTRQIYLLRKTLREHGESGELIQTVPRRGYRFTGKVNEVGNGDFVIEKHTSTRTLVEVTEEGPMDTPPSSDGHIIPAPAKRPARKAIIGGLGVAAFLLFGLLLAWKFAPIQQAGTPGQIKSIAVLPVRSFSGSSDDEELRLRITDALITRLGNLNGIAVRPTSAVLPFARSEEDGLAVGRRLQADAIIDGRIQQEGERLRVTLQLVRTSDGEHLWSEQFDGNVGKILSLQDDIALRLRKKFAFVEAERFNRRPTENNEAYEAYLKGRYFWNQRTPDSYFKAINYFQEAVQYDPNFALAYSGIADCYVLLNRRYIASSEQALPKADEAARKAVELDPDLAEAQASMGLVRGVYNRDWSATEEHFRRAIELNPNYAPAYGWYGMILSGQRRFDEAEVQLRNAEQLDPTSRNIAVYLAANAFYARDYDRAIERSRKALELEPRLSTAYMYLSMAFEQKEMYDQAVEADLERAKLIAPEEVEPLRQAFLDSGIAGFWRRQIEVRRQLDVKFSGCGYEVATRYALLGDQDQALKTIEENSLFGGTCWNSIHIEPTFDRFRDHPRFQAVIRKMNVAL